jgi:hypothetical protein
MAYGVIHNTIFTSSVANDWRAWVVLVALCVLADEDDNVLLDVPRLARITNLPPKDAQRGIEILSTPDPSSRNGSQEGRRIIELDPNRPGLGWHIVNRGFYKRMFSAEHRKAYKANWIREKRSSEREEGTEEGS